MAGVDYNEWGLSIEKWEADDASNCPPPHLLVDKKPQRVSKHAFEEVISNGNSGDNVDLGAINLGCMHGIVSQGRLLIQRLMF
ncbi:hypothetical protein CCACVL1_26749 [Corchorus capsularis]|uniref:Uncharacterized protein n=1 Tax=Corchorus capsularis TaxID=210143 RepID=A0A1R3GDH9_COCAP|nr:hypothetical protein CCACVL1_26749 [Corchorus capsularis]